MADLQRMPEVLAGVEEAVLAAWTVKVGDLIEPGTILGEVETEKALVDLESEHAGIVGEFLIEQGALVPVGEPILLILAEGEDLAEARAALGVDAAQQGAAAEGQPAAQSAAAVQPGVPAQSAVPVQPGVPAQPGVPVQSAAPAQPSEPSASASPVASASDLPLASSAPRERLFASPLARRMAREQGLDLQTVTGTGPSGRITRRDIERAARAQLENASVASPSVAGAQVAASAQAEFIPHTPMRRAIARRLTESKNTIPHYYLTASCRVEKLMSLRADLNKVARKKISVNDLVVKAVGRALIEVPDANVTWSDDGVNRYRDADIAVAVSTETGLLTPVVRGVQNLSIEALSETIADLSTRSREGRLRQHELDGGSFTVSNLGMFGTQEFSAIINPPHSGILAVGAAKEVPVVEDGKLTVGVVMTVTLSADHRALDGEVAAHLLNAFVDAVENPVQLLL